MEQFVHILTAPDNVPISAMVVIIFWVLRVAWKQATENDQLLDQDGFDLMAERMKL